MSTTVTDPPRLSRYRSLRKPKPPASSNATEYRPAQPAVPQIPQAYELSSTSPKQAHSHITSIDRSKSISRYHATRPTTRNGPAESNPKSPQQPASYRVASNSPQSENARSPRSIDVTRQPSRYNKHKSSSPPLPPIGSPTSPQLPTQSRYGGVRRQPTVAEAKSDRTPLSHVSNKAKAPATPQEQALEMLEQEKQRQQKLRDHDRQQKRLEQELRQAEIDKQKADKEEEERKRKIKEKEEAEIARAQKEEAEMWREKQKEEKQKQKTRMKMDKLLAKAEAVDEATEPPPLLKKLGFFKRKQQAITPSIDFLRPLAGKGEKAVIKPGGGGIVPLSDAPVSASNHGDRRVRIVTQGRSVLMPIKATTTPLQLIRSSVTFFDVPIDPRNSFLLEDFSKCGIQRNMRMYEHIRNILNSWDSDDQHTFTLAPYDSSQDSKLYATWAPKSQPSGGKWSLYFSQEKGKWDKRIITMTKEGQITAAKNEEGKGLINVCHLSDFEVYNLSREGEKKKIRPPKKYCYAIKSLQKSTMFLGDTGFIHMFCSGDQATAQNFHDTIYKWRCWYLVNVMGENGEVQTTSHSQATAPLLSPGNGTEADKRSSHYMLGSFNTDLQLDFGNFTVKEDPKPIKHQRVPSDVPLASAIAVSTQSSAGLMSASEHSKALHARQESIRRAAGAKPAVSGIQAFNSHHRDQSNNSSFQTDPSSQNSSQPANGLHRNSSVRSTARHSIDRAQSIRHRANKSGSDPIAPILPTASFGKPLIDLAPAYVEPPQHRGKGRGVQITGGPLVEAATTRHEPGAIIIPESQDWRRRGNSISQNAVAGQRTNGMTGGPPTAMESLLKRSSSVRSQTATKRMSGHYGAGKGLIGDLGGNEGFTGSGLLAQHINKS